MPPFSVLVEYKGEFTQFSDAESVSVWAWGKALDEMIFWFGECPVKSLPLSCYDADIEHLNVLLRTAYMIIHPVNPDYPRAVPARLGTAGGPGPAGGRVFGIDYVMQVGSGEVNDRCSHVYDMKHRISIQLPNILVQWDHYRCVDDFCRMHYFYTADKLLWSGYHGR